MMDMQVIGIKKDILHIYTSDFSIYISGNTENKKYNVTNNNKNITSDIIVETSLPSYEKKTINSFGELYDNKTSFMIPSFFEDGIYDLYLECNTDDKYEVYHHSKEIRENISYRGRSAYGAFKFNGDIGYSTFYIRKNDEDILNFTVQVFPTKLDYIDDYNEILKDINNEVTSLVFDFINKTFSNVNINDVENQTEVEFISILDKIFLDLEKSIRRVVNHPKHGVLNEYNLKDKDKCKKVSVKESMKQLRKNKSSKIVEIKKVTTLDIYENRYLKYMIKRIIQKIREVKQNIKKYKGDDNKSYIILCKYENKLNYYLNGFFREIRDLDNKTSITLVFKMASGYKEVYYYYNLLSKGLDIYEGLYEISNKKLWNLYEIWCYLKIHSIIKDLGYAPKNSPFIKTSSNGLTLTILQNIQSKLVYENRLGDKLELWYNKAYYGLPTTSQRPDTVLCLKGDKTKDRIYLFDAKYRIYIDKNEEIGPMEDDINVMHRYRDSIVTYNKIDNYFKYDTFGAYVMFPYSDEEKFKNHKFYKSIEKVNIGAIPMLPGSTSLMKKHISKIIGESYIEAVNNNPVFDEEGDYYKFKNKNVMIVNTKDKEHLDIYKKYKFYHIPKKNISNIKLGIDYLAFYQPQSKFESDSGIYYYAKIKDFKFYKRKECPELNCEKSKEDDIYVRFELEDFQILSGILSVEYGVRNVMYTTLYLLKNATTMHELSIKSRKEIDVYKILKVLCNDNLIQLRKFEGGYKLENNYIKVYDNGEIRVNDEVVDIVDLKKFIEKVYLHED